jgi:hypothetical protein
MSMGFALSEVVPGEMKTTPGIQSRGCLFFFTGAAGNFAHCSGSIARNSSRILAERCAVERTHSLRSTEGWSIISGRIESIEYTLG